MWLAQNALQRMAEPVAAYGIFIDSAVVETSSSVERITQLWPSIRRSVIAAPPERFWRTVETVFNDIAQNGAEPVVLVSTGRLRRS